MNIHHKCSDLLSNNSSSLSYTNLFASTLNLRNLTQPEQAFPANLFLNIIIHKWVLPRRRYIGSNQLKVLTLTRITFNKNLLHSLQRVTFHPDYKENKEELKNELGNIIKIWQSVQKTIAHVSYFDHKMNKIFNAPRKQFINHKLTLKDSTKSTLILINNWFFYIQ